VFSESRISSWVGVYLWRSCRMLGSIAMIALRHGRVRISVEENVYS
jgi:hypothetical protein